ncbi:MAG: T9SS type A sorting domain-containing protein [Bacteroidia bacterium]
MKKLLLFAIAISLSTLSKAQTFSIEPASKIFYVNTVPDEPIPLSKFWYTNLRKDSIHFKWKKVTLQFQPGWDGSFCDYERCYTGFPDTTNSMKIVEPGERGYNNLIFNPNGVSGVGVARIYVYDANFPLAGDTVTWIINVNQANGLKNYAAANSLRLYPNPANEVLNFTLENTNFTAATVEVIDILGNTILKSTNSLNQSNKLNISNINNGVYFLKCTSTDGNTISKKFYIIK